MLLNNEGGGKGGGGISILVIFQVTLLFSEVNYNSSKREEGRITIKESTNSEI